MGEKGLFSSGHEDVVMYYFVYQHPTDCFLVPVDSGVEEDGCRVAAGPFPMVYYGGGSRIVIPGVEDSLEFTIAETIAEILFVQLAVKLCKLEGLF